MSDEYQLGDGPVQEEYRQKMHAIIQTVDEFVNEGKPTREIGIVLLMFRMGDPTDADRCNFMSNGPDRADIVNLFKEMIARFEGQPEMKGKA
jgi:hypothetical protein